MILVLVGCSDGGETGRRPLQSGAPPDFPQGERTALAAGFAGHGSRALAGLLHDSIIVQPPSPESGMQGAVAIRYVSDLATHTQVTESRLTPNAVTAEGPFVFEQGTWVLRVGDRPLTGQYTLRWRQTPAGWKVVLWRWSSFR